MAGVCLVASSACSDPAPTGVRTIEYEGVSVEIPAAWERTDTSECDFQTVRWGAPDADPCEFADGVAFYGAAAFDPAEGAGVRRSSDGLWQGYEYAGSNQVVYVFQNEDEQLVRDILDSASS